jgi:putative spermidine/putrescine transport system substrate-binding protein
MHLGYSTVGTIDTIDSHLLGSSSGRLMFTFACPLPSVPVVVYLSPTIASMYVQAISAYAHHPNCAKFWMELLHSDFGQMAWMKGYVHGVNQAAMESHGVIPADLKDRLPASSGFASAVFPSPAQLYTAMAVIKSGWNSVVGVSAGTQSP